MRRWFTTVALVCSPTSRRATSTRTRTRLAASSACRTGISPRSSRAMTLMAAAAAAGPRSSRLCVAMSRQRRLLVVVGDRSRLLNHELAGEHIGPLVAFAEFVDRQPADALV